MIQLVALHGTAIPCYTLLRIACTNDGNGGLHTKQVRIAGYMAILLDQQDGVAAKNQKDQQINGPR
jgi:hypothetical protein